jgi:hypothetical protein
MARQTLSCLPVEHPATGISVSPVAVDMGHPEGKPVDRPGASRVALFMTLGAERDRLAVFRVEIA